MNKAIEILNQFEIRPSYQRIAVMDYLLKHRTHATADAIYDDLSKTMPVLSRTTVYNTLRLLVEKGAIKALLLEQDALHFDATMRPHAHMFCSRCRKIYDVEVSEQLWSSIVETSPCDNSDVQLNFNGICKECINNSKK